MDKYKPDYPDFNHREFRRHSLYMRLATEHESIKRLHSEIITWEVEERRGKLKIPSSYMITYHVKSVVRINQDESPVYDYKHKVRITLPPNYPIQPPSIYAVTPIWHPNIEYDVNQKGWVCSGAWEFGLGFTLYDYVIWVGQIIQYQKYLAKMEPPFPQCLEAARWVTEYAEPQGIVNKDEGIYIDNTPLARREDEAPIERPEKPPLTITINSYKKSEERIKKQITIKKKD